MGSATRPLALALSVCVSTAAVAAPAGAQPAGPSEAEITDALRNEVEVVIGALNVNAGYDLTDSSRPTRGSPYEKWVMERWDQWWIRAETTFLLQDLSAHFLAYSLWLPYRFVQEVPSGVTLGPLALRGWVPRFAREAADPGSGLVGHPANRIPHTQESVEALARAISAGGGEDALLAVQARMEAVVYGDQSGIPVDQRNYLLSLANDPYHGARVYWAHMVDRVGGAGSRYLTDYLNGLLQSIENDPSQMAGTPAFTDVLRKLGTRR